MFFAALPACQIGVDGNGKRATEPRAVGDFSRVESDSSLDVHVAQADASSVTVSIDSNLLPYVATRVSGSTLIIDVDQWSIGDTVQGPHVLVTMPQLEHAALNGSGRLEVVGFHQDQPIDLDLEGSGDVTFTGDVPGLTALVAGSGDMRLEGTAGALDLRVDGSGAIDAGPCTAASADVSVSGSGDVAMTVTGVARVSLSGSGNVDIYGGAMLERSDVSGSGSVRRH
jgi:hypothetical protein